MALPQPPPQVGIARNPGPDSLHNARAWVVHRDLGFVSLFHVDDGAGVRLAQAVRSMEGWIGMNEVILTDPDGRFLIAIRAQKKPDEKGVPIIMTRPFLAVDDQGQPLGELTVHYDGLSADSYDLMSQGEKLLSVPRVPHSQPYPVLQQGAQVAVVTESSPHFDQQHQRMVWTLRFTAPCQHLRVLALLTHVVAHRGSMGTPV